jgi:hypothetical protein
MLTFGNPKRGVHHEPKDVQGAIADDERAALRR